MCFINYHNKLEIFSIKIKSLGQPSTLSGSSSVSSGLPAAGKQQTAAGSSSPQQMILDGAKKLVPTSSKYYHLISYLYCLDIRF